MSESNGKNGNKNPNNGKKQELDSGYERNFNLYLHNCTKLDPELNDRAIYDMAKNSGLVIVEKQIKINKPNELKIIYSLNDCGEIIYHNRSYKKLLEIDFSADKPDIQDNLFFMLYNFWPMEKSRGVYYEDSDIAIKPPKYIISPPTSADPAYAREVYDNYYCPLIGFTSRGPGEVTIEKKVSSD